MSREEKWQVYHELEQELSTASDVTEDPQWHDQETAAAVKGLLDSRTDQYRANPESARPWQEVRGRLKDRFDAWKAASQSA